MSRFPTLFLYSLLAAHPERRRINDAMRKNLYWPSIFNDFWATRRYCGFCAHTCASIRNNGSLKCFPWGLSWMYRYECTENLTKNNSSTSSCCSDETVAHQIGQRQTDVRNEGHNLYSCLFGSLNGKFLYLIWTIERGKPSFVSKSFVGVCSPLGVNAITTTEYGSQ